MKTLKQMTSPLLASTSKLRLHCGQTKVFAISLGPFVRRKTRRTTIIKKEEEEETEEEKAEEEQEEEEKI